MSVNPTINQIARLTFQIVIFTSLTFLSHLNSKAQIAIIAGGNYSTIRNNVFLENKEPIVGSHFGLSFQYYPFKQIQNLSILHELYFIQKGYQQDIGRNYTFKFNYLSLPILLNYPISKQISLQTGIELSKLISTNMEQGLKTYNDIDLGLVLGVNGFHSKRFSCYSRLTYGLLPILDYYEIDELGNFKNEIHDLKNISLSIGIKFKLYNEKILSYQ